VPGIIRCPNCGQEIDASSRFCPSCATRICPGCHGVVPQGVKFCPNCGFAVGPAITGEAEQPAPPPVTPPPTTPSPTPIPHTEERPTSWQTPGGYITGRQEAQPPQPMPIPSVSPSPAQYGPPATPVPTPYSGTQPPPSAGPRMPSGPIPARRFPLAIVIIMVLLGVSLLGFATWSQGWLAAPRQWIEGIEWPGWLPFGVADTTPPVIQNVSVSDITQNSAVVKWETNEPATSQVMLCDPEGGCTWTEPSEILATTHSFSLDDLKPNVTYKFTATSTDADKNQAIYEGKFTTLPETTAAALLISGITTSNLTDVSITISWKTSKPASSRVEYGINETYGMTTPASEELTSDHSVTLTGLQPNTTYHYRVISKDAAGNEVVSEDCTFTTRSTVSVAAEVGPEVGKRAPDFTLPDLNGNEVSLSDYRGKLVIVTFWVDVRYAITHMPAIQSFYEKWTGEELEILAINWQQSKEQAEAFVKDKGLTFSILLDQEGEVADKYRANPSSNPTTLFIDEQGIIQKRQDVSFKTETQIEEIVKSL